MLYSLSYSGSQPNQVRCTLLQAEDATQRTQIQQVLMCLIFILQAGMHVAFAPV